MNTEVRITFQKESISNVLIFWNFSFLQFQFQFFRISLNSSGTLWNFERLLLKYTKNFLQYYAL